MRRFAFSVEQREAVRERLVGMGRSDARVVAGAIVGAQANGGGDRWSDLDLAFGLRDGIEAAEVLADWTRALAREFGAVHLFDLPFLASLYRVFLLPGNLQVDVSFTPAAAFGALGPRFELLFGRAVARAPAPPPSPRQVFGLGVHHAVRARFCIERGRHWQAEHWIGHLREQALTLACLRRGLEPRHGRGLDGLPAERLAAAAGTLVRAPEPAELLRALGCGIELLLGEADELRDVASTLALQLRGLTLEGWPGDDAVRPPA